MYVASRTNSEQKYTQRGDILILVLNILQLVLYIGGLALLGQGLLYVLAGHKRDTNLFYQALSALTNPFTGVVRRITPSLVTDRHVPLVTFMLLFWIWVFALGEKVVICRANPLEALCQ